MNLPPALLGVLVLDLLAVIMLAGVVLPAGRILRGWRPRSPTQAQLLLERESEMLSLRGRIGLGFHGAALLLLVLALNHVLPSLVPGAMCGVGALQAMKGGETMLAARGVSLLALAAWLVLDRLNRAAPTSPLARTVAETARLAALLVVIAAGLTASSLLGLSTDTAVSCCAVTYDLPAVIGVAEARPRIAGTTALAATLASATAQAALALWLRRRFGEGRAGPTALGALVSLWAPLAVWVLVDVAAPYIYGAPGHRCPLCLFLPRYFGIGYAVYGAILAVVLAALTVVVASVAPGRHVAVRLAASRLGMRACVVVAGGTLAYLVMTFAPAIRWQLQFGVWIG